MPLGRAALRNEFGLGSAELYRESTALEDPKVILDGVAVSGLIGLLRQLGDLAEFAADVFHELQEQIVATSSRSRRLLARVHIIEASFPPLEKAVFSQKSHIHFAYVAGCDWHPRIRRQKHIFAGNELPTFIMDSYEECRLAPRLDMLDKFDEGGPGSCLKRYSDPSFHQRISNGEEKKPQKAKKKRSIHRNWDSRSSSTSRLSECQFLNETRNGAVPLATPHSLNNREEPSIPHTIIQHDGESTDSRNSTPAVDSGQEDYVDAPNTIDSEPEHNPILSPSPSDIAPETETQLLQPQAPFLLPHQINESPPNTCESTDQEHPPIAVESTDQQHPPIAVESTDQQHPSTATDSANEEQPAAPPVAIWTNGGLLGLEPSKPPDSRKPNGVEVSRTFGSSFRCIDEHETGIMNGSRSQQPSDTRVGCGDSGSCSPPLERIKISFNPSCAFSLKLRFPDGDRPNGDTFFPSFHLVPEGKTGAVSDSDDDVFCTSSLYTSDGRNHSDVESEPWDGEEERAKDHIEEAHRKPSLPDYPVEEVTNTKDEENFNFLKQIRDRSFTMRRTVTMPGGRSSAPSNDTVAAILKKADAIRKAVEIRGEEGDEATWSD